VQPGCTPGRVDAGKHAQKRRKHQGADDQPGRDHQYLESDGALGERIQAQGQKSAGDDAQSPAQHAHPARFFHDLGQHVAVARPHCFKPISRVRSITAMSMVFITASPPTSRPRLT
jgi:hypothetical protein